VPFAVNNRSPTVVGMYGELVGPETWKPEDEHIMEMRDILTTLEGYERQITILHNQLEAEKHLPVMSTMARQSKEKKLAAMEREVEKLGNELQSIAKVHCSEPLKKLQTIPGIGPQDEHNADCADHNFQHFEDARKLSAYVGLYPRVYQSGTSVKGEGHICKTGNARARKLLYICTWTAQKSNAVQP
jgi:transposase